MVRRSFICVLLAVPFLLSSCVTASKFAIQPLGDKFSDPSKPYGVTGVNNRLSTKSSKGGVHIDAKGVYLDPFVYKDRGTNQIREAGFSVAHFNFEPSDGFRPIQEIIFLTDRGERIALNVKSTGSDFDVGSWNTISKQFNAAYREGGISVVSLENFRKITEATYVEVKIVGGKREQTYDRREVAQDFLANLKSFYATEISTGRGQQ